MDRSDGLPLSSRRRHVDLLGGGAAGADRARRPGPPPSADPVPGAAVPGLRRPGGPGAAPG